MKSLSIAFTLIFCMALNFEVASQAKESIRLKTISGYKKYLNCQYYTPNCSGNSMHCHYTGSATCYVEDQTSCPSSC